MTPWLVTQCLYIIAGGGLAPLLIRLLFARDHAWSALGEALPTFIVVTGTVLLWPILLPLLATDVDR